MRTTNKIRQYFVLVKFSLSFLVVFSSVMSYLLVEDVVFNLKVVSLLALGGFLITASANTMNQLFEKDTDFLMKRTASRPLASGVMKNCEAQVFAFICGFLGAIILWYYFGIKVMLTSLFSLLLYVNIYTPMKRKNSLSVFVGAIPGALPCLIGWLAGSPASLAGGLVLFAIQFIWQFPHFWAIAWISHQDYSNAGFKLLPSVEGPTRYAAIQSIVFSLILFPLGFLPYLVGISGWQSVSIIFLSNVAMLIFCIRLYKKMTISSAHKVMFASYFYLPLVFFSLYFFKNVT